jgi:hypothetical protein
METTQQTFLSQIKSELTNPQVLIDLQLFAKSSWALLQVISRVLYLAFGQIFVWGQQFRVYCSPAIAQITNKIYLAAKPVNNPVTQFIAELTQPKDIISSENLSTSVLPQPPQLDDNQAIPSTKPILTSEGIIFPPSTNLPTSNLDSQREQLTHTSN